MKLSKKLTAASVATGVMVAWSSAAGAVSFMVNVYEADVGHAFDATLDGVTTVSSAPNAEHATFQYDGPLMFSNPNPQNSDNTGDITSIFFGGNAAFISGYQPALGSDTSVKDFGSLASRDSFLASSGSVAGYGYGSIYTFVTMGDFSGQTLTFTHDDGLSVYANGKLVPGTTYTPTSQVTEAVTLPDGTTQLEIVYARENGSPSILNVSGVNDVPEPATWAMMIAGFGLVGAAARRRSHRHPQAI